MENIMGRTSWNKTEDSEKGLREELSIIMDDSLDSNGEEMEPDVSENLEKVTSYTLIVGLLCI